MRLQLFNRVFKGEVHNTNSKLTPLRAALAYLGAQLYSVYIVGLDENDASLFDSHNDKCQVMLFEKDARRLAVLANDYSNLHGVTIWNRFIDDGKAGRFDSFAPVGDTTPPDIDHDKQTSDSESFKQVGFGSLDQFYAGTGVIPELIKITPTRSVMLILDGCVEIIRLFTPLLMFRLNGIKEKDGSEMVRRLSNVGYHFVDIETNAPISESSMIANTDGYLLAIPKSAVGLSVMGTGVDINDLLASDGK